MGFKSHRVYTHSFNEMFVIGGCLLTRRRKGVINTQHALKKKRNLVHHGGQRQIISMMSWQNWFTPSGMRRQNGSETRDLYRGPTALNTSLLSWEFQRTSNTTKQMSWLVSRVSILSLNMMSQDISKHLRV